MYGDGESSLWRSFQVIILTKNHRQGKDKPFADMLNRIREGKQTQEDIDKLATRVRPENHPDISSNGMISVRQERKQQSSTERG